MTPHERKALNLEKRSIEQEVEKTYFHDESSHFVVFQPNGSAKVRICKKISLFAQNGDFLSFHHDPPHAYALLLNFRIKPSSVLK